MSYSYEAVKPQVMTDQGQRVFLKVRDRAKELLKLAGAFRLGEVISGIKEAGDTWELIACVDRLVELGEVVELTPHAKVYPWGQNRIFTDGGSHR